MKTAISNTLLIGGALVSLALTGCVSTVHPLSDAATSQPDMRLLGTWEFSDEEEKEKEKTVVVIRVKENSPNVLQVVGEEDGEKKTMDLLTVKIGGDWFASVGEENDDGKLRYIVSKYELSGDDALKLWAMDTDFFAAAVESKELNGTVKQDLFKDVLVDEPAEKLRAFLEKHGAKCWSMETPISVKRIKKAD